MHTRSVKISRRKFSFLKQKYTINKTLFFQMISLPFNPIIPGGFLLVDASLRFVFLYYTSRFISFNVLYMLRSHRLLLHRWWQIVTLGEKITEMPLVIVSRPTWFYSPRLRPWKTERNRLWTPRSGRLSSFF